MAMSPSPTVQGGQHDTKYVAFKLLMHTAFLAHEIWGFMPEPLVPGIGIYYELYKVATEAEANARYQGNFFLRY